MIDGFLLQAQLPSGLDAPTMAAGDAISQQLSTSEWLGPLAPIALSPFFGLCILSGLATYGPEWLGDRSALLGASSSLNNPWLFWTLAALAVITSLPRFTKVSKPLALAADNLEAYSAIVILVVVRLFGAPSISPEAEQAVAHPIVLSAGLATIPLDLLMSAFAALNVFVINAVKLFFEFLVWVVPFPSVDAILEVANKCLCAALMSLYCFSPAAATGLNLLLLVACAMVFGWTQRRLRYYQELVLGPALAWLAPSWFAQRGAQFVGFCDPGIAGCPRLTKVHVERVGCDHFRIRGRWLWRSFSYDWEHCGVMLEDQFLGRQLRLQSAAGEVVLVKLRTWTQSDDLYSAIPLANAGGNATTGPDVFAGSSVV